LKIISLNCNGFRSAKSKGLFEWISKENPDLICFQETKAKPDQCSPEIWDELGYKGFHHSAEKAGYSSVAIFSKKQPKSTKIGIDHPFFDKEGRSVGLEFSNYYLWNVYFPSGTSGDERQSRKMEFLEYINLYSKSLIKKYKNVILCGDVNIAHQEIDIHNPKGNKKNSGFLPEEREWLTQFLEKGWIDSFRFLNPKEHIYSWWSYRSNARKQNKGWRIDYFFLTNSLEKKLQSAEIHTDLIVSDHCPISIQLKKF
jgi:exodeoxyribonuclease III